MSNILARSRAQPSAPSSIWSYFDKVALWVRKPIDISTKSKLRQSCRHLFINNRPARFDPSYRQRLELKRPNKTALRLLGGLPGAYINQVEVANDYIFANTREHDAAYDF